MIIVFFLLFSSLMFDADAGQTKFLEDLFEMEMRNIPGGTWQPHTTPYTTVVSSCFVCLLKPYYSIGGFE